MPLRKFYFEKDFQFQYLVIATLTSLLRNFVALEWPRLNKEKELMRYIIVGRSPRINYFIVCIMNVIL